MSSATCLVLSLDNLFNTRLFEKNDFGIFSGKGTRSRSTLSSGYDSSSRLPSANEDSISTGRQRIVSDSGYQSYEPRRTKSVKY